MCLYRGEHDRSVGRGQVPLGWDQGEDFFCAGTGQYSPYYIRKIEAYQDFYFGTLNHR